MNVALADLVAWFTKIIGNSWKGFPKQISDSTKKKAGEPSNAEKWETLMKNTKKIDLSLDLPTRIAADPSLFSVFYVLLRACICAHIKCSHFSAFDSSPPFLLCVVYQNTQSPSWHNSHILCVRIIASVLWVIRSFTGRRSGSVFSTEKPDLFWFSSSLNMQVRWSEDLDLNAACTWKSTCTKIMN